MPFVFMSETENNPNNKGAWWKPAVELFTQVSVWIVAPIVLALVFGKMLDTRFDTRPWIFLAFAGIGFIVTCVGMYRVLKNYIKKLKDTEDKNGNK